MDSKLIKTFAKNRAEEFPEDVWGEYVLPPNYETINLFNYDKAVMIEGGRGSGKTMFLKYHCHDTRFSKKRKNVSKNELKKIGLYFRPDTHFCSGLTKNAYGKDWELIFSSYILISVLKEFYTLIRNLVKCTFSSELINQAELNYIQLPKNFGKRFGKKIYYFSELGEFTDICLEELNDWAIDPDSFKRPMFPDTRSVIKSIIRTIKAFSPDFEETKFTLYIDEYENLTSEQQVLLNTWIKHGQDSLIISAAYKKHARISRATTSDEQLVVRNDYRIIDVEDIEEEDFKLFAAEILLLKLDGYIDDEFLSNYKKWLSSENHLEARLDNNYSDKIISFAKKMFKSITYEDVASIVLRDKTLRKRLTNFLILPAIKDKDVTPDEFISDRFPVESILNGVLINRESQDSSALLNQFKKLNETGKNSFYQPYKDTLVGALLWIYLSAGRRTIPIYSGFERICLMCRSNIRHFLDICHQCLVEHKKEFKDKDNTLDFEISVELQALAARKNSEIEVSKVVELGRLGNSLRFIVNRLGLFFQLLQKRRSQSEPEIVHFGIKVASLEQLPSDLRILLDELKLWSVLIEYQGDTKRKSQLEFTSYEYMLHPMFSPNFMISFRKIRKHMFSVEDLNTIFCGSEQDFVEFCKPYIFRNADPKRRKYQTADDIQGSLFDEI